MKGDDNLLTPGDFAVAIPTFGRDQILLDTILACLNQDEPAAEIIVIDQTPVHDVPTENALQSLHDRRMIRWERLPKPSIPGAMNRALQLTERQFVLFLDDDIVPAPGLIREHVNAHNEFDAWAVVGQVIQPWQQPGDITPGVSSWPLSADFDFPFHTTCSCWLQNAMAGNMSVRRNRALQIGGFDENFKGTAYRFETEFARRMIRHGGRIRFSPEASIRHLRAERGGTRIHGSHLASISPNHGVGDYYFAMLHGWNVPSLSYMGRRLVREVSTKYHLMHPWWIPIKAIGELRALIWALRLKCLGQSLLRPPTTFPQIAVANRPDQVPFQEAR